MTREDKRAYNYARDRLANEDYPVYSDEYELKLAYKAGVSAAIQEVCEWLLEWETHQGEDIEIVEQFRKAMEGE